MRIYIVTLGYIFILLAAGCTHQVTLYDFEEGQKIKGEYNTATKNVKVYLPSENGAETLKGDYTFTVPDEDHVWGFGSSNIGSHYASHNFWAHNYGSVEHVHAILTSTDPESDLMMEIWVKSPRFQQTGHGIARTNDGKEYKINF